MLEAGSQYMGDTVGCLDAAGVFLFLEEDKPSDLDPELVPKPENSIFLFVWGFILNMEINKPSDSIANQILAESLFMPNRN